MKHVTILILISLSMICINSCSNQTAPQKINEPISDVLVGRVAAVYPKEKYMLIQKYKSFDTDFDSIFYTRSSNGQTQSIKVTDQKLGQFYVADISTDEHTINDPVFMRDLRKHSQVNGNEAAAERKASIDKALKN